ncbi:lysine--tRNA ligase, partial [archaeon]|nr:lysine--tRNA ligase [archaeon]
LAEKIALREKFLYLDKKIPELKQWTVKSSSSLSGVLHIGRLSDIIRSEAVYRALKERGFPVKFIYVTEDMDPVRSVPKGVPESFSRYFGFAVSDAPDPFGCHESYALHFKEEFLKVLNDFLLEAPEVLSMREEYRKGVFTESILALSQKQAELRQIIERVQGSSLPVDWAYWKPVCDSCGNLQTTKVLKIEGTKVYYKCEDYEFEKRESIAKGCGHEGSQDLSKANGKMAWKSEWASQWKAWNVCSEGAGKDYNAPNSAWYVNAEICERLLDFPMPEPIFYEHIFIGGEKMSASKGNVVYPSEWLSVARPEALKYLYVKRLSKARSFLWSEIPLLERELDNAVAITFNAKQAADEKELHQMNRLYEYSLVKERKPQIIGFDYDLTVLFAQLFKDNEIALKALGEQGYLAGNESKEALQQAGERLNHARKWVESYAPEEKRISFAVTLPESLQADASTKKALNELIKSIPSINSHEDLQSKIFSLVKENSLKPKEFFALMYQSLIARQQGPKLGSLILALGKERVIERLKQLAS